MRFRRRQGRGSGTLEPSTPGKMPIPPLVLPTGTRLFHGTLEKFWGTPRPGGYDGVCWTADSSAVAQSYIPKSGGTLYLGIGHLRLPSQDTTVQALQRRIGIIYDYTQVTWGKDGRAQSWLAPRGGRWHTFSDGGQGYTAPSEEEVLRRLKRTGWIGKDATVHSGLEVRTSLGRILRPDEVETGRLYFGVAREPLNILDAVEGEEYQANDLTLFRLARKAGYDGVQISDQLQSEIWGNVGHIAIGLFPLGLAKMRWRALPAKNYDEPDVPWQEDRPQWATTPEWAAARAQGRASRNQR